MDVAHEIGRATFAFHVDAPDVFPENANADQLHPAEEQDRHHQRRPTGHVDAKDQGDRESVEDWVTSGLLVTYGKDEDSVSTSSRVVDLMIVDGKVKKGYVYQRELSDAEKTSTEETNE